MRPITPPNQYQRGQRAEECPPRHYRPPLLPLFPQVADEGYVWLLIPNYGANTSGGAIDTSHGHRTAWLAARADSERLVEESTLNGLINTLESRIWAPEKGPLYLNNYAGGSDDELSGLEAGGASLLAPGNQPHSFP